MLQREFQRRDEELGGSRKQVAGRLRVGREDVHFNPSRYVGGIRDHPGLRCEDRTRQQNACRSSVVGLRDRPHELLKNVILAICRLLRPSICNQKRHWFLLNKQFEPPNFAKNVKPLKMRGRLRSRPRKHGAISISPNEIRGLVILAREGDETPFAWVELLSAINICQNIRQYNAVADFIGFP